MAIGGRNNGTARRPSVSAALKDGRRSDATQRNEEALQVPAWASKEEVDASYYRQTKTGGWSGVRTQKDGEEAPPFQISKYNEAPPLRQEVAPRHSGSMRPFGAAFDLE